MLCYRCGELEKGKRRESVTDCMECGKVIEVCEGHIEICEKCSKRLGMCKACGETLSKNRSKRRMK